MLGVPIDRVITNKRKIYWWITNSRVLLFLALILVWENRKRKQFCFRQRKQNANMKTLFEYHTLATEKHTMFSMHAWKITETPLTGTLLAAQLQLDCPSLTRIQLLCSNVCSSTYSMLRIWAGSACFQSLSSSVTWLFLVFSLTHPWSKYQLKYNRGRGEVTMRYYESAMKR